MGEVVDPRTIKFIKRHHVMTLATVNGAGEAYCANLFYAYSDELRAFVFTSDSTTRHAKEMIKNGRVAASIVLETRVVGSVQGLQICGVVVRAVGEESKVAKSCYLKRFPYAAVVDLSLWVLRPDYLKLTDNRLGFGKKLIWQKDV